MFQFWCLRAAVRFGELYVMVVGGGVIWLPAPSPAVASRQADERFLTARSEI